MAFYDFEPPSFSLGLDLETQPDPLSQPAKRPSASPTHRKVEADDDSDEFETPVRVTDQSSAFKRLRRGLKSPPAPVAPKKESIDRQFNANEEIEDFSSDEDCPRGRINSVCSSSKPSLVHRQGLVTTESGTRFNSNKATKGVPDASVSNDVGKDGSNVKLTISPLRRYQLIDCDLDDPSTIPDPLNEEHTVILSPKEKHSNSRGSMRMGIDSAGNSKSEDLWKNFHLDKNLHVSTPAFDEVFEEYFDNVKNKSKFEIGCKDSCKETKLDEQTLPPAHGYFFHNDLRIQKLVRDRLPHFLLLGSGNNKEYVQPSVSAIDYLGQFCQDDTRLKNQEQNIEKSFSGNNRLEKQSSLSQASSSWANPRSCAAPQKNAGSRRVQAVSKSSGGRWYMGSDGKRVYVNKQGMELTGQIAYRQYKKESGTGFKSPQKKKSATKKANAKKFSRKKK